MTGEPAPTSIDEYIAGFPDDVRPVLEKVRATIRAAAPGAEEGISYKIPAFTLDGRYLVYFAGYRSHVSVYPAPSGVAEFQDDMAVYGSGKGTAKFPLNKPIPYDLVTRIVKYRVDQRLAAKEKKT